MVKLKGQLLSLGASGSVGKVLTYSNWKGRAYVKHFQLPKDPKSAEQVGLRAMMAYLSKEWKAFSVANQETWRDLAIAKAITPFDAYVGQNLTRFLYGTGITKERPAAEGPNTISPVMAEAVIYERYLNLKVSAGYQVYGWATFVYRSQFHSFDPGPDNLVHVFTTKYLPQFALVKDVPPSHATWYYRAASSNKTGTLKMASTEWDYTW